MNVRQASALEAVMLVVEVGDSIIREEAKGTCQARGRLPRLSSPQVNFETNLASASVEYDTFQVAPA